MLKPDDFFSSFGKSAESAELEKIYKELNTLRRPDLDDEDETRYFDWVLVKRNGVELGFADAAYLAAEPAFRWGYGELLFCQVYFYGNFDGITAWQGDLPFDLQFTDNRGIARQKLRQYEASRRSWRNDTWTLPAYDLTIVYRQADDMVERVVCRQRLAPIQPPTPVAYPAISELIDTIGRSLEELRKIIDPTLLEQSLDDGEIDLRQEYGLVFHLAGDPTVAALIQAITFHANRDNDSSGWRGELPLQLEFNDSPEMLRRKIGARPIQESDSLTTGHGVWELPDYTLHILYSNFDNRILRLTLRAPGTWKCIDEE